jgi:casein kinase I homolog HRR25
MSSTLVSYSRLELRATHQSTHTWALRKRRDDLESLTYVLIYFFRDALPWQGLKAATKSRSRITTPTHRLCRGFPNELNIFPQLHEGTSIQ